MAFTPIETQEDFDAAIKKRLEQKEREVKDLYKGYLSPEAVEELRKELDGKNADQIRDLTDKLTKAQEKAVTVDETVKALTDRATAAEKSLLKQRVAHSKGIALELAERLIGDTEEELTADAENFAAYMTPHTAPPMRSTESPFRGMSSGTSSGAHDEAYTALLAQLSQ